MHQMRICFIIALMAVSHIYAVNPPPNMFEMIHAADFVAQVHEVQTSDDYLLSVFRIPARRHQNVEDNNNER
jgi:hypothetical protein